MSEKHQPIWDRTLEEPEWKSLLADAVFMQAISHAIEEMASSKMPGDVLLITNWPKDAHQALLPLLPENLAGAFDLSVFNADGAHPYLDETEGFRLQRGHLITGPAGVDEVLLTPHGDPLPLGPYADIAAIMRVPLPMRVDRTWPRAGVRVMPAGDDLELMVGQFRCGQALLQKNGTFRVEEVAADGTAMILAAEESRDGAADRLLAAGLHQAQSRM